MQGTRRAPSCTRRSTQSDVDVVFDKGQDPATDGYSAFEAPELGELLRDRGIDNITVVGLATDYCVKNTALDALQARASTCGSTRAAVRGVDVKPGDSRARARGAARGRRRGHLSLERAPRT